MIENFYGNAHVAQALLRMLEGGRVSRTILLDGPEGVGKATLARRVAAHLLGGADKIEQDDLSLDHNRDVIAEREKWTSEKRSEDPLLFSTHPDFITFCPEGPLRQISIQQMRLLKERAQYKPLHGLWRVFLIDQIDRANLQAADSLLKTLEEPPEHLLLILTAENPYDLPATIRSRSIPFRLGPLNDVDMRAFARSRQLPDLERRLALAGGSPGLAATLDLGLYEKRRAAMLALLSSAVGTSSFGEWVQRSESFYASKSEKLDFYLKPLYGLLEDLLVLAHGGTEIRNDDLRRELGLLARHAGFDWIRQAVEQVDELAELQRRNVQKSLSLDAFVVRQRAALG